MLDQEMLSAIADLLDTKFDDRLNRLESDVQELKQAATELCKLEKVTSGLTDDLKYVRVVQLENNVIPRLNTIENCYLETSKRYLERTDQIDVMQLDIDVLKSTVEKHSEKLQGITYKRQSFS